MCAGARSDRQARLGDWLELWQSPNGMPAASSPLGRTINGMAGERDPAEAQRVAGLPPGFSTEPLK